MTRTFWARASVVGCFCLLASATSEAKADDLPETVTSRFLGAEADRAGVSFVLQQSSPLFGGREYYISGDGRIVIVDIQRNEQSEIVERRFEFTKHSKQTTLLIEKVRKANLLNTPLEQVNVPGPTCTTPPLFIIRNAAGDIQSLPLIKGAPTKAYEDVMLAVAALANLTLESEPVYQGRYDKTFVPKQFEWTSPILTPGKDIRWAPKATAADIEKAEQEYLKKVEIQLKLIDAARAKRSAESKQPEKDQKTDESVPPKADESGPNAEQ